MKTADAVGVIANRLAAAGIEDPRREARIILAAALGTDAAGVFAYENIAEQNFETLVQRRAAREPLAYILGRREFWGLEFMVSPATLIPRPDSETIIEAALAVFPERNAVQRILDLGTGTGCLLLAALHEFPAAYGIGVDSDTAAAALARRNAELLGLAPRAAFFAGDWAAALDAKFDLILCNPPYIPAADLSGLMPEVAKFEPRAALDGGADGLAAYRCVIAALPALLAQRGVAILELGFGQEESVAALAEQAGFATATRADLAKIPRALVITPCGPACPK
jgi:release factor glutamine methyltransferase